MENDFCEKAFVLLVCMWLFSATVVSSINYNMIMLYEWDALCV